MSVNRTEVTGLTTKDGAFFGGRPLVPNRNLTFIEPSVVGASGEKPKEFFDNRTTVDFFRGCEREAFREVEAELRAKDS